MATRYYQLDNTKQDGTKLRAAEWDFLVGLVDAQLQGALELHGAGVAAIPDANSLLVEIVPSGVSVRPGVAVLGHTVYGHVFSKIESEQLIAGSEFEDADGDQNFVHLALQVASEIGAPDTRTNQTPQLAVSTEEALDGHLALAQVTLSSGVVTAVKDLRHMPAVASGTGLFATFFGSGRITGLDRTVLAPSKVDGGLSLLLPEGSKWFIGGQLVTLDFDVTVPVPANRTAWGVLSLDEAGLPTVADADWLNAEPPRGVGIVGRIVSDNTSVTTLDKTTRDVIQIEAGKQARFEALETLVAALSEGANPDDPDAPPQVTVAMFNAFKLDVNARLDALEAGIAAVKASLGTDSPVATRLAGRVETLRAEHSRLAASVVRNSPRTALRLRSSIVIAGVAGMEDVFVDNVSGVARYVGGNLHVNPAKRRLE